MVKRLDGELFHLRCRDPTHEQEDPRRNIAERPYEMLPLIEKKKRKKKNENDQPQHNMLLCDKARFPRDCTTGIRIPYES